MARSFTVAAAQLGPSSSTKAQTVERMVGLIQEAGRRDVELLTFFRAVPDPVFCHAGTRRLAGFPRRRPAFSRDPAPF